MSTKKYNWKRFWCPRAGRIALASGGYLADPETEYGRILNPDVVPYEAISTVPCLILLGEPGMGKSMAMARERDAINQHIAQMGAISLWFDLRGYQTDVRLCQAVLAHPDLQVWRESDTDLYLFFDSLDECLLRIDTIAALLIEELEKLPVDRLKLRIACRTADWPVGLEEELCRLWSKDDVGAYVLAPLRLNDVAEAAAANDLPANSFLTEVAQSGVIPLATKPVTLDFLLNVYRRQGGLPVTQSELYRDGLRLLCEEPSTSRRDAQRFGVLDTEQRLKIAARIAAVTVFANRYATFTGLNSGDLPEEDVTIATLCGGNVRVSEAAIRETLGTGLFSSRGLHRMGWAHQTYAEFLAAFYLIQQEMSVVQMMSLIRHGDGPNQRLVPQLHEAAAWLASLEPKIFREILKSDPDVLLRSDVAASSEADRAALVDSLLRLYDEEKLLDRDVLIRARYQKLLHPHLEAQLKPYITGSEKSEAARHVAIDIAEACNVQNLQTVLAALALNQSQPMPLRVNAAYAVRQISDSATEALLRPLALGQAGPDPDDELKGCGLRAAWPEHLTAEELFSALTPPREGFFGAYHQFLSDQFVEKLVSADLPLALDWVAQQPARRDLPYTFREVIDAIMLRAWEYLDEPNVLDAYVRATLSRLSHFDSIVGDSEGVGVRRGPTFDDMFVANEQNRRQIVEAILDCLYASGQDASLLLVAHPPILVHSDLYWFLEQLEADEPQGKQRLLIKLIRRIADLDNPDDLETIRYGCERHPLLAEAFALLLGPIRLDSPEAAQMRDMFRMQEEWERSKRQPRPLLTPPPEERIRLLLDRFEAGDLDAWWNLNMQMMLEPDGTWYHNELEADLTRFPGWQATDASTCARILRAAQYYLLEGDPQTNEWLGTNTIYRPAFAGYRAARLLLSLNPDALSAMPVAVWQRWAAIIVAYPLPTGVEGPQPQRTLVQMAYRYAPDEIIAALLVMIDKDSKDHGSLFILDRVDGCWDNRLIAALLDKAADPDLPPYAMYSLLCALLEHNVHEAKRLAQSLLPAPPPHDSDQRARGLAAARALASCADDAGWQVVWLAIQTDTAFGRELLESIAYADRHRVSLGRRLPEDALADLYVWLAREYPHAEDPREEGWHEISPREGVAQLRDGVLAYLREAGSPAALEAIRRIAHELPELDWLKWTLLETQAAVQRHTWVPPDPLDILNLVGYQQARLVQSGDQLLEVLIESLKRLELKLQGETAAAIDLWNEEPFRPRSETQFSDYVKRHLDDDLNRRGVIVNREVELRPRAGEGRGERTDIHVDAITPGGRGDRHDVLTVIVEVKGNWNTDLWSAMQAQLVDRYLTDNHTVHGLYLVGWFTCDQWRNGDQRRRRVPKMTIQEAQEKLTHQAEQLSGGRVRVEALIINAALRNL